MARSCSSLGSARRPATAGSTRLRSALAVVVLADRQEAEHQPPAVVVEVAEAAQFLKRPARHGHRQGADAGGAAEPHRRIWDHAPAAGGDLDRFPPLVGQVQPDGALLLGDAHRDGLLCGFEQGFALQHADGVLDGLGAGGLGVALVEQALEPAPKRLGLDRPGLAVLPDGDDGVGVVGVGVEQLDADLLGGLHQQGRLGAARRLVLLGAGLAFLVALAAGVGGVLAAVGLALRWGRAAGPPGLGGGVAAPLWLGRLRDRRDVHALPAS